MGTLRASRFQPITRPSSVFVKVEGGTTFGRRTWMGPSGSAGRRAFSPTVRTELRGNEYVLFTGGYLHDLWRLPPFVGKKVYVATQVETAKVGGQPGWAADVAAGLVAQTMFGPLPHRRQRGDEGHRRWFFELRPRVLGPARGTQQVITAICTASPRWFCVVTRNLTNPWPGRLPEGRTAGASASASRSSPGRTAGASGGSSAGADDASRQTQAAVTSRRMVRAAVCQPLAASPWKKEFGPPPRRDGRAADRRRGRRP